MSHYKQRSKIYFSIVLFIGITAQSTQIKCMDSKPNTAIATVWSSTKKVYKLTAKIGDAFEQISPYILGILSIKSMIEMQCMLKKQTLNFKTFITLLQPISLSYKFEDLARKLDLNLEQIKVLIFEKGNILNITGSFTQPALQISLELISWTSPEQLFALIAHELMHVKDKAFWRGHVYAPLLAPLAINLAFNGVKTLIDKAQLPTPLAKIASVVFSSFHLFKKTFSFIVYRNIGRYYEKRADLISAQEGKCAQALIDGLSLLTNKTQNAAANKTEIMGELIRQFIEFSDDHLSLKQRIAYLTPLAQEQARERTISAQIYMRLLHNEPIDIKTHLPHPDKYNYCILNMLDI